MERSKAGSRIRLVHMATNNVIDTITPIAAVPPKLEAENIENPQKRITAVYIMLKPVPKIELVTAWEGFIPLS